MILRFCLGIDDARQPIQKERRGVDEDERQLQPLVTRADLRRFVQAQDAVVHEDAGQLVADRAVNDERGHRRIDAAAERADHAPVADLRADSGGRLFDKRRHRPVAGAAADAVREVAQDLETAFGVRHLGMKQEGEQPPLRVGHRGNRGIGARRDDREPCRRRGDEIAVAGPDADLRRDTGKQRAPRPAAPSPGANGPGLLPTATGW